MCGYIYYAVRRGLSKQAKERRNTTVNDSTWLCCFSRQRRSRIDFIIWLAPRASKMSQILRCDWLRERARWSYLARSGLPVARPLDIESLIPTTMQSFLRFSRCFSGKRSLKSSVNSQHLPKGKERQWNRPGVVKTSSRSIKTQKKKKN